MTAEFPDASDDSERKTLELYEGSSFKLNQFVSMDGDITWSSSDKNVVTVSSKGKAKAKSSGVAVITAKSGNKSVEIEITVLKD